MTAIETDSLTKRFGEDVLAVDDLTLTIEEGEIFGFLGPNGAGKSTTINMLLDFIRPTDGSATVLGHDTQKESGAIRRKVGVLPEGANVYDRLTGREHVEWAIRTKGVDDDPDEILDKVGLDHDDATRQAGGYSKGMAQRLSFGMALVGDPELLILDEPSSGLDPNGIQEMRDLIREEAASGTTVFFSSHILPEVEAVCDRVGIMNEGQLATVDTIENLRDSSDGQATIDVELGGIPDRIDLSSVDGVVQADVDDGTVTVVCEDPSVKVDVVTTLARQAEVVDILSEDTSLEELFNTYTTGDAGSSEERVSDPAEVSA
ncbi:ABC transporter ATP-binding protein [Halostella pelagica]|uniref:ABC transporter ATP-binding protein n=1 Tax=Halostella pelagica TaxID=2583824 RepID=UPI0010808D01|nr:ABC transporter ATP-binding protein [Halostella pelagica]